MFSKNFFQNFFFLNFFSKFFSLMKYEAHGNSGRPLQCWSHKSSSHILQTERERENNMAPNAKTGTLASDV